MFYVLKSSRVLDVLVPILFYLNEARNDKCEFQEKIIRYFGMEGLVPACSLHG